MEDNKKFLALTPDIIKNDYKKSIYTDALDYAFSNSDIKNIAITGIYGAGKSSIWRTYVEDRNLTNAITVSLGKYEDSIDNTITCKNQDFYNDEFNEKNNINKKGNIKKTDSYNIDSDNRIERQLINQILSQINNRKIPLSKYKFKSNKSNIVIIFQILSVISAIFSIFLWFSRKMFIEYFKGINDKFESIYYVIFCLILFLIPLIYFLYVFFRDTRFKVSRINIKGAEANLKENDNNDETILDRDIKEIVYLLISSETEVLVIEDLDRYDNISVFTKLRELNFLLNKYYETSNNSVDKCKTIRFVYMVKDGLFISKNRTKFFDFIIPIVPVIDSKNSENKLIELIASAENKPDRNVIFKISMYIDDMRLLKNISNEFLIYEKVIPVKDLELDANKLFALIVLKNIFPLEFDLLQADKGYIYNFFSNIDECKNRAIKELNKKLDEISGQLKYLDNSFENSKFEAMAAMISPNVRLYDYDNKTSWLDFLKEWSMNPDKKFRINNVYSNTYSTHGEYTYKTFVDTYILNTEERINLIEKLSIEKNVRSKGLKNKKTPIEGEIKEISLKTVKDQLKLMSSKEIEKVFADSNEAVTQSHYFPLIRFLIVEGLLDETYWYYKGCFYKGSLGKNDTIFMKNLWESKEQDIFLNIENPQVVKERLDNIDFERFNILNKELLEICIKSNCTNEVYSVINSVKTYDSYDQLIEILDTFDYKIIKKFIELIIDERYEDIIEVLDRCQNINVFENILRSVCTNNFENIDILRLFNVFVEQNENIISLISEEEFGQFIENILHSDAKFIDISESEASETRIEELEKIQAYKLNVSNIMFIVKTMLKKETDFGKLISIVYNHIELSSTKKYIEDNFDKFITMYVNENVYNESFNNEEDILVRIINSSILDEHKKKYIKLNKILLSDINKISDLKENVYIVEDLFDNNCILFNDKNINTYWRLIEYYSINFVKYLDVNLNDSNYKEILSGNREICNSLINDPNTTDNVFNYTLVYADDEIKKLDSGVTQERIKMLIDKRLILITEKNIEELLMKSYHQEITNLINSQESEQEDKAINILLTFELEPELIYKLINGNLSYENSIKLVDSIIDEVLIENISFEKTKVIKYLIVKGLSNVNINYICKHFDIFLLKDEFVNYLDDNNKFNSIKNDNLNCLFVDSVLSSDSVSIDSKVDLIIIKILGKSNTRELIKLISSVPNISELTDVWNNKRPALNNSYKEKVGEALANADYVYKRNDKDWTRIVAKRSSNNEY